MQDGIIKINTRLVLGTGHLARVVEPERISAVCCFILVLGV